MVRRPFSSNISAPLCSPKRAGQWRRQALNLRDVGSPRRARERGVCGSPTSVPSSVSDYSTARISTRLSSSAHARQYIRAPNMVVASRFSPGGCAGHLSTTATLLGMTSSSGTSISPLALIDRHQCADSATVANRRAMFCRRQGKKFSARRGPSRGTSSTVATRAKEDRRGSRARRRCTSGTRSRGHRR